MAWIKCDGCGEIIEIPAELCPYPETPSILEPYFCDACEKEHYGSDTPWEELDIEWVCEICGDEYLAHQMGHYDHLYKGPLK